MDNFTGLHDRNGHPIYEGMILREIIGRKYLEKKKDFNIDELHYRVKVEFKNAAYGYTPVHPELQHEDDKEWKPFYSSEDKELIDMDYFEIVEDL